MWLKKNEHLRNSKQCCGQDVKESFGYWNRRNFNMKDISVKDTAWPMHIYSYSGVIFAVYPIKSGGQIYFVLVMFASEAECSKYKFEMIAHERGSWALDSVMSVKFCGNPLGHILSTSSRFSTHIRGSLLSNPLLSPFCRCFRSWFSFRLNVWTVHSKQLWIDSYLAGYL